MWPPLATRSETRNWANSGEFSQKNNTFTAYPFACARRTRFIYDLVASVVSIENVSSFSNSSSIRFSINRPASIATLSGLNGERPLAISSAFTNSLQSRISGSTVYDAVVFPAPLQPLMIYKFLFISGAKIRISEQKNKLYLIFFRGNHGDRFLILKDGIKNLSP